MIIDHLGYLGVVRDPYKNSICRAIGRSAAPPFFFLAGVSGSYRFRWICWWSCVYIWLTKGIWHCQNFERTFESMHNNLFINLLFRYVPFYKLSDIKSKINQYILHTCIIVVLLYNCSLMST
eukprot:UN27434